MKYEEKNEINKKNLAFIGGINKAKGIDYLKKIIQEVNLPNSKYNLHLFGKASEWELNCSNGNYYYHNTYDRKDIVNLLKENKIDLILLLAIWPETYSYTLTEAALAEVPVVAIEYGALKERIEKNNLGWILPKSIGKEEVLSKIDEIFYNEAEYEQKKVSIKKYISNLKSNKDMAQEYANIYVEYNKKSDEINYDKNNFRNLLKFTKLINSQEEEIKMGKKRIEDYHYTIEEYKKELERLTSHINELGSEINNLNSDIQNYKEIEKKYNHLISSRKLNLLKRIKFIEF